MRTGGGVTADAPETDGKDDTATIFGIATINGSGSFVFRVDIVDGGEPSSSDHFRIRLSTGCDSGDQLLMRGNVQVH